MVSWVPFTSAVGLVVVMKVIFEIADAATTAAVRLTNITRADIEEVALAFWLTAVAISTNRFALVISLRKLDLDQSKA